MSLGQLYHLALMGHVLPRSSTPQCPDPAGEVPRRPKLTRSLLPWPGLGFVEAPRVRLRLSLAGHAETDAGVYKGAGKCG